MTYEMKPRTPAGVRFAEAAAGLVPGLRERAAAADRSGEMCIQNFTEMQRVGVAAAFVPEVLGGFGLTSVHDWMVGIRTLAQGDGSAAIAINMHLGVSRGMARVYQRAADQQRSSGRVAAPLEAIAAGSMLICATATERGTDNLHPLTTATRTGDGWQIDGSKMFVTLSPIATHLAMNLRMQEGEDSFLATVLLPIDTPGVLPQDDWDALGMRGSGSQSVRFEAVRVPAGAVRRLGPWGRWSIDTLINRTLGNLTLVAAFLGIAEHAHDIVMTSLRTQKRLGDLVSGSPGVQHTVGEMEIELAQCRSVLQVAGLAVDEFVARSADESPTLEQAHGLMSDYQVAKWVVNRGAINIVDKALDLVGGGGFMSAHPLSQLYRDVRAGPFMQPHAATEIRGYIGQVALGVYPDS